MEYSYTRSPLMKYTLQDLFDIEHFQNLQDRLNEIHSFPSAIIDNEGNILTVTEWQDICVKFHANDKDCERFCMQSDQYIQNHPYEANLAMSSRCPHGLVNNATPIIIDDILFGNFFTGRFFPEKPDLKLFRARAKKYGFDEDAYLEAVKKVPVRSQEMLNKYLSFSKELITIISESGLLKLKEIQSREKFEETEECVNAIIHRMHDGFLVINPQDGMIIDANEAMCRMSGYTRDEIVKMSVADVEANDSPEEIADRIKRIIQTGPARFQSRLRRRNSNIFDVEVDITYLPKRKVIFAFFRNIAENRQVEVDLRESEERLRDIIFSMADWVWEVDKDGRYMYSSQKGVDFFGRSREEVIGKTPFDFMPPEEAARVATIFADIQSKKAPIIDLENWNITKSGKKICLLTNGVPILDDAGNLKGYRGVDKDITERKQTEKALRESEERYHRITDAVTDYIFTSTVENGAVVKTVHGPGCIAVTGYSAEEFAADPYLWINMVIKEDRERVEKHALRILTEKDPSPIEHRIQQKNGSLRWVLNTPVPHRDSSGALISCDGLIRDITERKLAEEEKMLSQLWLRLFIDANSDLIFLKDLDLKYQMINAANAALFGRKQKDILGKTDYDLMPEQSARACRESDMQAIHQKRTITTIEMQGGREYEVQKFPVIIKGNIVGVAGIIRDITERKALETKLIQAQKMEAVGRLAGGVAHDFNNMLGIILGHTELALGSIDPLDPLHSDLEEIQNAGKRSADLTRQLLAFARKQTVAPQVLDLNEIVEGMLKMLRRLIGEDISLSWNPGNDLMQVKIDPSQLDQILANLCVNSRDAITDVGKITIETANVAFDEEYCTEHTDFTPGAYVMLAVSDNGCGMDKETLSKLFEPFFTTKEMGKGTGLGLSTVYGIVKQNNGFINIYSEPGKGTTFKIYLPNFGSKEGRFMAERQLKMTKTGSETILLVEDEPAILKLGKTILERIGYTVLVANKPSEAIQLADEYKGQIHLLMTDVVMPDMNGRDLAKHLLSLYPNIKLLFMSGYTSNVIAHHGVLDEGVHFIQKPFSLKDLSYKVREALDEA